MKKKLYKALYDIQKKDEESNKSGIMEKVKQHLENKNVVCLKIKAKKQKESFDEN